MFQEPVKEKKWCCSSSACFKNRLFQELKEMVLFFFCLFQEPLKEKGCPLFQELKEKGCLFQEPLKEKNRLFQEFKENQVLFQEKEETPN